MFAYNALTVLLRVPEGLRALHFEKQVKGTCTVSEVRQGRTLPFTRPASNPTTKQDDCNPSPQVTKKRPPSKKKEVSFSADMLWEYLQGVGGEGLFKGSFIIIDSCC